MRLGEHGGLVCTPGGTLGLLVQKSGAPGRFLLTCSHVAAKSGRFGFDFKHLAESQRVVQQSAPPSCNPQERRVGLLTSEHSVLEAGEVNSEDCALVLLDAEIAAKYASIQRITGSSIRHVAPEHPSAWPKGMPTRLLGANRLGEADAMGSIIGFREQERVGYPGVGEVPLLAVVLYETQCREGDSGGAVIDDENRLLGMHVAGNIHAGRGLFLPLGSYMKKNGLNLVSE